MKLWLRLVVLSFLLIPSLARGQATCVGDLCQSGGPYVTITDIQVSGKIVGGNVGLSPLVPVRLATVTVLPNAPAYSPGNGGIGATITGTMNGALNVDGTPAVFGDRILVKNQTLQFQNGVYTVTAVGGSGTVYQLVRAADLNQSAQFFHGVSTYATMGSTQSGAGFVLTSNFPLVIGTSSIVWNQYSEGIERTKLSNTLNLYRSPTGSDNGTCTSSGAPCLTRNYIWNMLINNYDLNGFSVIINDADGTYTDSFTSAGNPVGNKDFTQIVFLGHVGNPSQVKWKAATGTGTVMSGGPTPGQTGFAIDSVEFDGASAAPGTLITTTQGTVLLLENVIFGCNPGAIDVNPSVGSTIHFLDYSIDHRLCSGVSTITTTSGSPNVTFVASTGPGIASGDLINDTSTDILPHTTFQSVNNGAGTAVLTTNATASATTNIYYANASLNHIQMDPQSVVDYQPTTVTPLGGGNFAWGYSGGFITNNNAQFFTLTAPTFGTSGYIGPPFAALNNGAIYSPGAYSLTALPGETHTFSGTFAAAATSVLLSTADFNRLAAYANYVTNGYGIPLTGTGIQPGTVILNIPSSGTTIYLSKPTTALGSGATITYGGQLVAGGLYFGTTSAVLFPPDGAPGNSAVDHISYQPGLLTAVNATKAAFHKFSKASTVDNIEGSAATFTCAVNPTITVFECGTSTNCASAPVTIGTVTLTAAGAVVDGTVSAPAIAAGDYVAFAMTAGTCTAIDLSAAVQIHAN